MNDCWEQNTSTVPIENSQNNSFPFSPAKDARCATKGRGNTKLAGALLPTAQPRLLRILLPLKVTAAPARVRPHAARGKPGCLQRDASAGGDFLPSAALAFRNSVAWISSETVFWRTASSHPARRKKADLHAWVPAANSRQERCHGLGISKKKNQVITWLYVDLGKA